MLRLDMAAAPSFAIHAVLHASGLQGSLGTLNESINTTSNDSDTSKKQGTSLFRNITSHILETQHIGVVVHK
jgi:hypothetical protein